MNLKGVVGGEINGMASFCIFSFFQKKKIHLRELVSFVPRKHYINRLTVWELRSLCNLNAVSVTKIGPADKS